MSAGAEPELAPSAAALPWRVRAGVALGVPLLRLLARTWRVREVGREGLDTARREGAGVVLALWHGQMLPMLVTHRDRGVAVLISEHRDGEIIARVAHAFGCRTVRGSTSRGGSRALLEMVAQLRRGVEVAVTPDGPRGPRHQFAPGALLAAHRAAAPLVGMVAHIERAWRLRSWDEFEIPKPFSRITIAYTPATRVEAASARDAAAQAGTFEERMHALRLAAEAGRGTAPERLTGR
ncbi:MAG TPA: lysophospholipid acyltransferase family protein [Gemmatirosa sp.]|nr:lysophospholipid acyltransferase family protein [Gemmatirosa sp.]